jgi:hypothetical protein
MGSEALTNVSLVCRRRRGRYEKLGFVTTGDNNGRFTEKIKERERKRTGNNQRLRKEKCRRKNRKLLRRGRKLISFNSDDRLS